MSFFRRAFLNFAVIIPTAFIVFWGCSKNFAKSYAPEDKKSHAENLMEEGKYAEASTKLSELLTNEPANYSARSLYAASLAAQGGLVLVDLIVNAAEGQKKSSKSSAISEQIESVLPSVTLKNIALIKQAAEQMKKIPEAVRTEGMKTQFSIFLLVQAFMQISYLQANPAKLATLSENEAELLIKDIADSAKIAADSKSGSQVNPLSDIATQAATKVNSAQGDTAKQKLASFAKNDF